jgi:hypothetical protein
MRTATWFPWTPPRVVSNTPYFTTALSFPDDARAVQFWLLNLHTIFENKQFLTEYEN